VLQEKRTDSRGKTIAPMEGGGGCIRNYRSKQEAQHCACSGKAPCSLHNGKKNTHQLPPSTAHKCTHRHHTCMQLTRGPLCTPLQHLSASNIETFHSSVGSPPDQKVNQLCGPQLHGSQFCHSQLCGPQRSCPTCFPLSS
jgi:hypothetical protein